MSASVTDEKRGRCRTCPGIVIVHRSGSSWIDVSGGLHTKHTIEEFASKENIVNKIQDFKPRIVEHRITVDGAFYTHDGAEVGPFTVQDELDPESDKLIAGKLGVDAKDVLIARIHGIRRSTTFKEVAEALGSTIRRDEASKLILFAAGLLTFTEEDQVNILLSSESAAGKSYNALEVAAYFPKDCVRIIAGASPTAFFHDQGKWDSERKLLIVDLRGKLLIFLDNPHYTLLEKLRPLLSHDQRELLYKITDKSKQGALRTKNVLLQGFPSVVFCAASLSLDDQERTRVFILSPETEQEKLEESVRLTIARIGNREVFQKRVESNPLRRWLKSRVVEIQKSGVKNVIIEDHDAIYEQFRNSHPRFAPRNQRDISRILALIKAHAVLNCWDRKQDQPGTIIATSDDVEMGFWLYGLVAEPNELGLSPQLYMTYKDVIKPNLTETGLGKEQINKLYYDCYGRRLPWRALDRDILPALDASSLISLRADPTDRRRMLVYPPHTGNTFNDSNNIATIWDTSTKNIKPE